MTHSPGPNDGLPPRRPSAGPERGRSASVARRVGVNSAARFNRTKEKTSFARRLRRDETDVEARLWSKLRRAQIDGHSFRRQHPAGPYVLDFYCAELRLAIELDGGQHNETPQQTRDARRNEWLRGQGVTVLRFWNSDVTSNLLGVSETIKATADRLARAELTPTRRWRHSRCFASASLPTAAAGRLCLPLSGGGRNVPMHSRAKPRAE
jgi:very-short-patch-repair endonuclease